MKKILRFIRIFIVMAFIIIAFSWTQKRVTLAVDDEYDFANKEDYYYELCSNKDLSENDKKVCKAFRDYLEDRQEELEKELKELEASIKDLKADIANQGKKIREYTDKIEALEKQINSINKSIVKIEDNIEQLQLQIDERELHIAKLDVQIKEGMVVAQAHNRTNSYVKFVMGADSFVDLLRRISAINNITSYNRDRIEEMEKEKVLLQADKEAQQLQKDELIAQKQSLNRKQVTYNKLLEATQELIDEYHEKMDELQQQADEVEIDANELDEQIKNIDKVLESFTGSKGFGKFLKNKRFRINSACYYYHLDSGGFHAAIDVGRIGYGVPYYPIANGYVFAAKGGCPYNGGYLGNRCNGGAGNYVFIIIEVDGKYYSVFYEHLTDIYVHVGDLVYKEKTVLGTSGNSGSSTGPHLHLAIYYQGTTKETSIKEIIALYKKYGMRFGLKYNITGACYYRNYKAPCYMNPMEIYGFEWQQFYWFGD
ncbi:MAG: peptidoglycan DD-metalloendopeptidase family protein [Erysipelotrichaceae bacterium]|nr:peptidoglycan DD-metalloendopeptidase family protein [Erysipelotrichaceae bacterium]